jgi:hypothetical protein
MAGTRAAGGVGPYTGYERVCPQPASTLVERVAQTADTLAGRVKQLEKELEQAELQVLYYKTVIRVAEQELGVSLEKSPLPSSPTPASKPSALLPAADERAIWVQ